jgi:hypothetical protein
MAKTLQTVLENFPLSGGGNGGRNVNEMTDLIHVELPPFAELMALDVCFWCIQYY